MLIGFAISLGIYLGWLVAGGGPTEQRTLINDGYFVLMPWMSVILATRVARHPRLDGKVRRAWALISLACLATAIAEALWLYYEVVLEAPPFPSWADVGYLAFYPLLLGGVLSFPADRRSRAEQVKLWLDIAIVMLGAGMVLWYFVLRPIAVAEYSDALSALLSLAYPLGDLALLVGIMALLLTPRAVGAWRPLRFLIVGTLLWFGADTLFAYLQLQGSYVSPSWIDALWALGYFFLALSAHRQHQSEITPVVAPALLPARPLSMLPYAAVALGYGLVVYVLGTGWIEPLGGLVIGSGMLTALVIARQIAAVRENARLLAERERIRAQTEEAIRRSEARFRSLVQNASDLIMVVDRDTIITYQTPSVQRLLGYEPGELIGARLIDLLHPDDVPRARVFFARALGQPGPTAPVEWRIARRGGAWLEVETIGNNVLADPNVRGIVLTSRDIGERRARELAEAANQAKSIFLATMTHELRTPLTAIMGYRDLIEIEAEARGYTTIMHELRQIQASSQQLLGLINGLLDLARIEAGTIELYAETFPIEPLLDEVVRTIQPLVRQNHNILEVRIPGDLGTMHADLARVRQTLLSLLDNAAKFTTRGRIVLSVRRVQIDGADWVIFRVADTGIGMTPEQMQQIFRPFMRVGPATTRKYGSSGLGLALAQRFCRLMGGDLTVESKPGQGSVFTVRLPAQPSNTAHPRGALPPGAR